METQRIQHALSGLRAGNKAAFFSDADGRQAKTRSGDASEIASVKSSHVAAIPDDACFRIRLLPEIAEVSGFHVLQECIVLVRKNFWLGRRGYRSTLRRIRPRRSRKTFPSHKWTKRSGARKTSQNFAAGKIPDILATIPHRFDYRLSSIQLKPDNQQKTRSVFATFELEPTLGVKAPRARLTHPNNQVNRCCKGGRRFFGP